MRASFLLFIGALALSAQINFYSREKEAALGEQLAAEESKITTPLDSVSGRVYVHRLGRRLAAAVSDQSFHFTFYLIKDDLGGSTHEPVALPAGYIFVPAKLVLAVQREAELAGMLAHAMAHVTARHGTRGATKTELMKTGTPPRYVSNGLADGWPVPLGTLTTMRAFEREADLLAIPAMSTAGYDPAALVAYISRTQTDRSAVFATLPSRANRIAEIEKTMARLPSRTYMASSEELTGIQTEVRRLMP
jgi:predicted Zn-dependent protease